MIMLELDVSAVELDVPTVELDIPVEELEVAIDELDTSVEELDVSTEELEVPIEELETSAEELEEENERVTVGMIVVVAMTKDSEFERIGGGPDGMIACPFVDTEEDAEGDSEDEPAAQPYPKQIEVLELISAVTGEFGVVTGVVEEELEAMLLEEEDEELVVPLLEDDG